MQNIHVILDMPEIHPMIVAIWCGFSSKPTQLNEYLRPFVDELNDLLENGIFIYGHHITVKYRCCICDSPARAYIKGIDLSYTPQIVDKKYISLIGTVYFNSKFGCHKCETEGVYSKETHRMSFPRTDAEKRTDTNFRSPDPDSLSQIKHIKEQSIMQELPIDMIVSFPTSDPLHLLELGVTKKYSFS